MNKKTLIILLVIILLVMSFLLWLKNSEDINNNLNNIPVLDNSGESVPPQSMGGIDINLSDDDSVSTEKDVSGEFGTSGDNLIESGEKEPTFVTQPVIPEKENNIVSGNETESGDLVTSGETKNPVLVSDNNKLVFKLGATQIMVYYYDGEIITKMESYIDYKTEDSAKTAATQYNDGTKDLNSIGNIESASSQGKYVVMTYNKSEYETLTFTTLKMLYGKYEVTK